MTQLLDDLRATRKKLEDPKNWAQGDYWYLRNSHGDLVPAAEAADVCCMCLFGAALCVTGVTPEEEGESDRQLTLYDALMEQVPSPFHGVPEFNDDPNTTHADVLELIDRAIAKEESDMSGTENRVYGGDPRYLHVEDGKRADFGIEMAEKMNRLIRQNAQNRTDDEKIDLPLCPGCYMVVAFNMLLTLADANGQSRRQLALSMAKAFETLASDPDNAKLVEEIVVVLDPEDCNPNETANPLPANYQLVASAQFRDTDNVMGDE